jgi:hypothetical protein
MEQQDTNSGKGALFTVKNVVRILSVLCIAFFFCPSFLVSCSSYEYEVSAVKSVGGVTVMGEKVASAHPVMLLCVLLPIAVIVLSIVLKDDGKKTALITFVCYVVDFIIWIVFRNSVKSMAENYGADYRSTIWFKLNVLSMVLVLLLLLLVLIEKLNMDAEIKIPISYNGNGTRAKMENYLGSKSPGNTNAVFCSQCGKKVEGDSSFCPSCGALVNRDGANSEKTKSPESTQEHIDVDKPADGNLT